MSDLLMSESKIIHLPSFGAACYRYRLLYHRMWTHFDILWWRFGKDVIQVRGYEQVVQRPSIVSQRVQDEIKCVRSIGRTLDDVEWPLQHVFNLMTYLER
jgi:hypothetical protein